MTLGVQVRVQGDFVILRYIDAGHEVLGVIDYASLV